MATFYPRRFPTDTKYVVHPHYATEAEAVNEAIVHQVRHIHFHFVSIERFLITFDYRTLHSKESEFFLLMR